MQAAFQEMAQMLGGYVPKLLGAIAVLILGWIVALAVGRLVRGILKRTTLGNRFVGGIVGEEKARDLDIEGMAGSVAFYLIMLLVLVAFFQILGLSLVAQPLNEALGQMSAFLPRLLGAALLLLAGWLIATGARMILMRAFGALGLDDRLGGGAGIEAGRMPSLTRTLSDTAFWLVLLLFLPAVLGALALQGLLEPVQQMLAVGLSYLPNLFAAGLTLLVGWFAARILQRVVGNLLAAAGADRLGDRVGLDRVLGTRKLSFVLGFVVYVMVLIPVVVAALDALRLEAISRPASQVLNQILSVIPSLFAAIVVLGIAYIVGRMVSGLVSNLLSGAGFDKLVARLGLTRETGGGWSSPSELAGLLVLVAIMLLASMEAFRLIGFPLLADMIAQLNVFASKILVGLALFAVGLFLANLVHEKIRSGGTANAGLLAVAARVAILVLVGAMALQQMGIGSEIARLVITVLLGAVAVAAAIAFGLGSRDIAGRLVEQWLQSLRSRGGAKS